MWCKNDVKKVDPYGRGTPLPFPTEFHGNLKTAIYSLAFLNRVMLTPTVRTRLEVLFVNVTIPTGKEMDSFAKIRMNVSSNHMIVTRMPTVSMRCSDLDANVKMDLMETDTHVRIWTNVYSKHTTVMQTLIVIILMGHLTVIVLQLRVYNIYLTSFCSIIFSIKT